MELWVAFTDAGEREELERATAYWRKMKWRAQQQMLADVVEEDEWRTGQGDSRRLLQAARLNKV